MRRRGPLVVVALATLAWPTVGGAEEAPSTTSPPDTTAVTNTTLAPETTLPPATTAPPATTEPPPTPVAPAPEAAQPEGGPRTLSVTPHTGLVHGQTVVLQGRGWPPHQTGMGAAQCITGTTDTRGCGPVRFYDVDAAGNFRGDFRVTVFLDTALGTFDCRVEQCVLGANYTPSATGARSVPLDFDPAGPDPVRHTATVTPDTGLVDGQQVQVAGDGFHPDAPNIGNTAIFTMCRTPVDGLEDCDEFTRRSGDVDVAGHIEGPYTVATILELPDGSIHDCRTGGCVLSVVDLADTFAEGALVPLGFDPVGPLVPLPDFSATPTTGLVDGDRIHVTGSGWQEHGLVGLLFCPAGAGGADDCDQDGPGFVITSGAGTFDEVLTARTILHPAGGGQVDCRVEACALVAAPSASLRRAVEVPLGYDPAGGLLHLAIEVRPDHDLADGDRVLVRGTGGRPGTWLVARQCLARATSYHQCNMADLGGIFVPRTADRADPVGQSFSRRFVVHRILHLGNGDRVDCAIRPCAITVGDEWTNRLDARAAIDFARGGGGDGGGDGGGGDGGGGHGVGPVTATPTFTG